MNAPAELTKMYSPAEAERDVRARWEAANAFAVEPTTSPEDPTYSIVIPPPNVTAALHLGHALNNTLQDVLTRYHRMRGDRTLWMPGTDHAGIATQTVVEKRLLSQGIKRLEMGREAFVEKTQEWKDEYEGVILEQLKALGASCDYNRTRFTMDDVCATAVRHAFFLLFQDGLIYRGKRLVNWDPVTRTALADDEVEMEEVEGHMWYLNYPLADGSGHVTVATTRPETMLGDTAVAVNPNDPLAETVRGKEVLLPIVGRTIPIVEDDYVVMADPEGDAKARIASGFLKVTPAHDPNDWEIGLRHDLPIINVMGPDGGITDKYGWDDVSDDARAFVGLSREDARTAIVEWFESNDLLDKVIDYSHSVGHSYRSHVPIEPWLSDQWYVAVTDDKLRGSALRAQVADQAGDVPEGVAPPSGGTGDSGLRFHPPRYARTFHSWHENIRNWCISRQLWWGHQIPVWNRTTALADASPEVATALAGSPVDSAQPVDSPWVAAGAAHLARLVTDDEVEESICIPPASSLSRLDRADQAMDEPQLVTAVEADGFVRDPDVLDTWFSSGLWPMSTMGWPWPQDFPDTVGLLDSFNPTSLLTTAREIITLWVSRMVMFNRYFMDGQLPFDDVFIHAMIQDGHGQKMSKSLGNGVDPRDIIHTHGADAMRFSLTQMTTDTQDLRMPVDMICPHSGDVFTPEFITTSAGHTVAAPTQTSPADNSCTMVSNYGVATGQVEPSDEQPLARNTSPKFDVGRNFANKVWNATRFALGSLDGGNAQNDNAAIVVNIADAPFVDRWIVSRLAETTATINHALENYQFNVYADTLYHFVWDDFCDNYLEAIKPTVRDTLGQQVVLGAVLDAVLRLMHPVCPFVTEALWANVITARSGDVEGLELGSPVAGTDLLVNAAWPVLDAELIDTNAAQTFARAHELATDIRRLRAQRTVKPKQQITLHVDDAVQQLIDAAGGMIETLAVVGSVHPATGDLPQVSSALAFEGSQVIVSDLTEEVDVDAEAARLDDVIADLQGTIKNLEGRLSNEGYVNNAKPELVQESRDQLAASQADLAAATTARETLAT